ncbi:hypothetical protein [Pararhodobacter oceanensis]|uniref:hypothetical protein n=1 Tax=Pararhodobacter oceanensis TaxID=2172121 RepID=UPI00197E28C9|nr:hypothetical protein [Pararhodobacter oceanensis]
MDFLSDILLTTAAIGAAAYCYILSKRLKALASLEGGMGSAIAVLSAQVDDLTKLLNTAKNAAGNTGKSLEQQSVRAEAAAQRLELLVASMHDLPPADEPVASRPPAAHPAEADPAQDETANTARARVRRRRRDSGVAG